MADPKKPQRKSAAARSTRKKPEDAHVFHAHLIRIPDMKARQRALMILGEVRVPYCGFPDYQMLIANEHLEALRRENIPFELLS